MNSKLAEKIEASHDTIVKTWVTRLQNEVSEYKERHTAELRQTIQSHLDSLIVLLKMDDDSELNKFIAHIARFRSEMNFNLSSIERAFFIGKEVICKAIKSGSDIQEFINDCKDIEILFLRSLFNFTDCYARIREEQVANKTRKLAQAEQSVLHYQELEKEKQKLEGILSAIGAGLSLIDANFEVLWFNEYLHDAIHKAKAPHATACFKVHWNQNEACEDCPAKRTFQTGRIERVVRKITDSEDDPQYFQIDAIPVQNENGQTYQVLELVQDISDAVKLEQQFLKSERLASLGKLAAKVAHEIRNPLSSISLNTELLEDEINNFKNGSIEEAKSLLSSIMSEIERLVSFTEEYLQFYRLPRQKLERVDLNQLILDLLTFQTHEFAAHKIRVTKELDKKLPDISLDRRQMRQALLNILKNSMEAMPQGGQIAIRTKAVDNRVELQISDTGCGIEKEHLNDIFELFYSSKNGGTGLGLAIAQQIILGHHGTIACESQPGFGTALTIHLPGNHEFEE
ncbi:RsbRD N-terminal domain-containing protein [candidate division KSB1 bacterium]|nr:RsbRD N-terminal domain-containing protein [candidate division KSB1 bacterium]